MCVCVCASFDMVLSTQLFVLIHLLDSYSISVQDITVCEDNKYLYYSLYNNITYLHFPF